MRNEYKHDGRRYGLTLSLVRSAIKKQKKDKNAVIVCYGRKQVDKIVELLKEEGADTKRFVIMNTNDGSIIHPMVGLNDARSRKNR